MSDTAIVQITRATALLTQAKTLEETLEVRDRASAVEAYARARGADRAQRLALELKLRAERKAGGFLREMPRVKPKDTLRRGDTMSPRDGPTLKDLGIEKKESERWQKIAAVPEDRFEDYIQSSVRKTQRGLLDLAEKQYIREPIESAHGSEPVLPIIYVDQGVVIRRVASPPSHWTFTIPPVRELLEKYVGDGRGWADPYCGRSTLAEWRNDIDPHTRTKYHMEAEKFVKTVVPDGIRGALFDPPYSKRQISEHYRAVKKSATWRDTSEQFYSRTRRPLGDKVGDGGYAISFGWNTTGFGSIAGFKLVEILMVNHSQGHNDTLVTVERKGAEVNGDERKSAELGRA